GGMPACRSSARRGLRRCASRARTRPPDRACARARSAHRPTFPARGAQAPQGRGTGRARVAFASEYNDLKPYSRGGGSMKSALAFIAALTLAGAAQAQQKIEMKLAYFVGDQHAMAAWLVKWSEQLEKLSGGRLVVKRFPAAQMGPTPQHYDFAR